jgi:monovalent cation/hydrogen antiporter
LLALATPFIAFWLPHAAGGSGVIACVAGGLWVSWNGRTLIRPATRLQGYFIWDLVTWVVEALIFLLTGLEAPAVVGGLSEAAWAHLLAAGALVSATVILVRFVWVFPATYLPRLLSPALRRRDPYPNWRVPMLIGYTGLRGAVSLAAALSIPYTVGGQPFPERELVLLCTFFVIVVTLVGQGSALPWVIRRLGLGQTGREEAIANGRAERVVRIEGVDAVLEALGAAQAQGVSPAVAEALRRRHVDRRAHLAASPEANGGADDPLTNAAALQLTLVDAERRAVMRAYAENRITDEARRRIERELDLEEARVHHLLAGPGAASGD